MTLLEKFAECTKKIEEEYGSNLYPELSQLLRSEGFTKYFFSDSLSSYIREEFAKTLFVLDNIDEYTNVSENSMYDINEMDIFYFRENDDYFDIVWVEAASGNLSKHYIIKNEYADLVIPFMKDIEPYQSFEDIQANRDFKNPRHTLAKMSNDLQFKASEKFVEYCTVKGYIQPRGCNKRYGTTQYRVFWDKVNNEWPKIN